MKHRWLYPANWEELAWQCKERDGWRCQGCGILHGTEVVSERSGVVYTVYVAAAHVDHDPWNPAPRLITFCPTCHGRYDWSWHERQRWLELEDLRHRVWVETYTSSLNEQAFG